MKKARSAPGTLRAPRRPVAPHLGAENRLAALQRSGLLDGVPEEDFDRLTRLVTTILHAPMALVSLVDADRQILKSHVGLPEPWASAGEIPLSHSFCQHIVALGKPLVIADARQHPLVRDSPAIPDLGMVAYAGVPLRTAEGHVLGSFCVADHQPREWTARDVAILHDLAASVMTEIELGQALREAREARAQADVERTSLQAVMEQRDEFLSSAAHDLKTPLTSVRGYAQLAQRRLRRLDGVDTQPVAEQIERIVDAAGRMLGLINDFMDVTRGEMGVAIRLDRAPTDLVALVRGVVQQHQGTTTHRFRLEAPDALRAEIDAERVERVLNNLLSNALKYSPDGSEVMVRVDTTSGDEGHEGHSATITVRDQGIGILSADLPRVGERFHRGTNAVGRVGGTGVGLASARRIVADHGGTLTVASAGEGQGTTVSVLLPLHNPGERSNGGTIVSDVTEG